jgi:hypothetical protein
MMACTPPGGDPHQRQEERWRPHTRPTRASGARTAISFAAALWRCTHTDQGEAVQAPVGQWAQGWLART